MRAERGTCTNRVQFTILDYFQPAHYEQLALIMCEYHARAIFSGDKMSSRT